MLALADGEVLGPDPSLPVPHQLEAALHSLQMLSGAMARAKDERDAAQRKAEVCRAPLKKKRGVLEDHLSNGRLNPPSLCAGDGN